MKIIDILNKKEEIVTLKKLKLTAFPDEIFDFPHIKTLDLSNNLIEEIPDKIEKLVNLETLIIQKNVLKKISPKLGKLKNLKKLNVFFNQLTELPDVFKNLSELTELEVKYNQLTELPNSILCCEALTLLDVSYTNIEKLPTIGYLPNLEQLNISYTNIKSLTEDVLYCNPKLVISFSKPILFLNEFLLKKNQDFLNLLKNYHTEIIAKIDKQDVEHHHQIYCNKKDKFDKIPRYHFFNALGLENKVIHKHALEYVCDLTQNNDLEIRKGATFSIWGKTILHKEQYIERATNQELVYEEESLSKYLVIGKSINGKSLFEQMKNIKNHVFLTERQFNLALESNEDKFFYAEEKYDEIENIRNLLYSDEENVEIALTMLPSLGVPSDFLTDLLLIQFYQKEELQKKIEELVYLYASEKLLTKITYFKTTNLELEPKTFIRNLQYWTKDTEIDGQKIKDFRKTKK